MPSKRATLKLPELIGITEVSRLLRVTPQTLRRWDREGLLKPVRRGKTDYRKYKRDEVLKLLAEGLSK
jgi:DNA-binding transcriptional MerR regulator